MIFGSFKEENSCSLDSCKDFLICATQWPKKTEIIKVTGQRWEHHDIYVGQVRGIGLGKVKVEND